MNVLNKVMVMATLVGLTSVAVANDQVINQAALPQAVSVKQALTLKDDSNVTLKGYVVKSIGDEKYEFRDATGTITVDIDDDLWQGKSISAKTPVTLVGEVDIDLKPKKRVEIDVDRVIFEKK